MSKLLINENPLVLLPSLAVKIGLNQAIVIQQIHYWLQASKTKINDKKWVYNTIDEWHEQFPFFSRSTLERAISSLVKDGFLIVEKLSGHKSDRTNYYTIDYIKLNQPLRQNDVTITSNCGDDNVKMTESTITSNCGDGYTEITETTTEKNTKTNTREDKTESNLYVSPSRRLFQITQDWKPEPNTWAETLKVSQHLVKPEQFTDYTLAEFIRANLGKEEKTEHDWQRFYVNALARGYIKPMAENTGTKKPNPHIYRPEPIERPQSSGYVLPKSTPLPVSKKMNPEQRKKALADLESVVGMGV